jgi:hypothetical protein
MPVPFAFSAATSAIPLSQLDTNFDTTITLGNTAIQLGNTVTTLNNMTLANVTISSGNVTITNVTVTTANVTTVNATTVIATTANVTTANVATSIVTGSETLSYGTVNGVAYLNGSKVLTTGSALTFDGTNFNVVRAAAIDQYVSLYADGTGPTLKFFGGAAGKIAGIVADAASASMYFTNDGNKPFIYAINGSEQMRLTSTGLGIGESSPAYKLDVNTAGGAQATARLYGNDQANVRLRLENAGSSGRTWELVGGLPGANNSNFSIRDVTGSTTPLTIDSSGNLGLGVTPSAWSSFTALQISRGSLVANSSELNMSHNAYYDGSNWKYIANGFATNQYQYNGGYAWRTAASGTANDPVTFTQAMTLDASGRLGIGETSPGYRVEASTTVAATSGVQDVAMFRAYSSGSTDSTFGARLLLGTENLNGNSWPAGIAAINDAGGSNLSSLGFYTATSEPTLNERARITSGGDLLVGTTSGAFTGRVVTLQPTSASDVLTAWNSATTGDNALIGFFTDGGVGRGSITYNRAGGLVAYNVTSDYRAKDILGPVANPGATIDALTVYEGQMKGATQSRPMLVAHEAQAVAPYSVTGEKDAVNESGDPIFQQMDVSSLVPLLIAEIQSLRQRVAQLEGA